MYNKLNYTTCVHLEHTSTSEANQGYDLKCVIKNLKWTSSLNLCRNCRDFEMKSRQSKKELNKFIQLELKFDENV